MTDATTHEIMSVELDEDDPPEDVSVETVRSGLESEDNLVRAHAAHVAAGLTAGDLDAAKEVLPTLIDCLDDERTAVVVQCSVALTVIAEDEPSLLEPAVSSLVDLLDHDLSIVRSHAARILGLVALEHPEYLRDYVDVFVEAISREPTKPIDRETLAEKTDGMKWDDGLEQINRDEEERQVFTRGVAANLLVEVAELDPSLVESHVPRFISLLDDVDLRVVLACVEILGTIAEEDPDAVTEAVGPLEELLTHDDETVVANAIMTLGFIQDPATVEPLRELADGHQAQERDDDLRELAAETADFIESSS